ncbi:MAG: GbsR/MarR family transcriptional regulator [Haloplanus sp.]
MTDDQPAAAREEVIESLERSAEVYGLSRSAGRVYGVLYFSASPLSIPELVEETGYAKSTISNVTRKLTRIGMVRRRSSGGGGRRVQFEPETDLWFVLGDVLRQYARREMQTTRRTLDRAADRLDGAESEDAAADRERIRELDETYERFERLLELAVERSPEELIAAIEAYDAE